MNAGTTGTQSHLTTDDNPQGNGNQPQSTPSEARLEGLQPDLQPQAVAGAGEDELTPDRPPQPVDEAETKSKRPRGFAAMDRKLVSEIARKGGKAAHSAGTAHEFTSEEARVAGRKGGRATHAKRRKVSEETLEKALPEDKPST